MDETPNDDRVHVATDGPQLDGILFDAPSKVKVVVAVMDRSRGPVLRTVHRKVLSERTEDGPDDAALRLLVRRTPAPARGAATGGSGARQGRSGHTRAAMHRTTGK
jgi:hypothetical protein